jgi:hypothetical protein
MKKLILAMLLALTVLSGRVAVSAITGTHAVADCTTKHRSDPAQNGPTAPVKC